MVTKDTSWVNKLLFPAPECSYSMKSGEFLWIPRPSNTFHESDKHNGLPALFLTHPEAKYLILYSHGNGCDIGQLLWELKQYRERFKVNILAYEYSGYGLLNDEFPSETKCLRDIRIAYNFATNNIGWPSENIIIFGRSLGTGPSLDLLLDLQTQNRHPCMTVLQSPYLSFIEMVKKIAQNLVGSWGKFASIFFSNRFENETKIGSVTCPILLIHGQLDKLIPVSHSQKLFESIKSEHKHLYVAVEADHNSWDMEKLKKEIQSFMEKHIDQSKLKPVPQPDSIKLDFSESEPKVERTVKDPLHFFLLPEVELPDHRSEAAKEFPPLDLDSNAIESPSYLTNKNSLKQSGNFNPETSEKKRQKEEEKEGKDTSS